MFIERKRETVYSHFILQKVAIQEYSILYSPVTLATSKSICLELLKAEQLVDNREKTQTFLPLLGLILVYR